MLLHQSIHKRSDFHYQASLSFAWQIVLFRLSTTMAKHIYDASHHQIHPDDSEDNVSENRKASTPAGSANDGSSRWGSLTSLSMQTETLDFCSSFKMKEIFATDEEKKKEKKGPAELVSFAKLVCVSAAFCWIGNWITSSVSFCGQNRSGLHAHWFHCR